jgi:hypothetical protein
MGGAFSIDPCPLPLFHPNMSPETIEITGIAPQSLQISWNHLTSASIVDVDFEGIAQLFQHALQMSCCQIRSPTIHHMLQTLGLHVGYNEDPEEMATLFGSLTLPCLREFHTNRLIFLTPAYLPALLPRSSRPLTSVTDLILGNPGIATRRLLLEDYLPNLRHLTIRP